MQQGNTVSLGREKSRVLKNSYPCLWFLRVVWLGFVSFLYFPFHYKVLVQEKDS